MRRSRISRVQEVALNRGELLQLRSEKTTLERMLAETPVEDVLDRSSLAARLKAVDEAILRAEPTGSVPARVRLTFKGRPVVGSHGIFAEFGMKAVSGFTESVTAMAASLTAPLAAMGPIPNREQHQLLITSTALGSFGFELEEHLSDQLTMDDTTAVAEALDRTQAIADPDLLNNELHRPVRIKVLVTSWSVAAELTRVPLDRPDPAPG